MVEVALFDLDGTILDTRDYIYLAFKESFRNEGINITEEQFRQVLGRPLRECYEIIGKLNGFGVSENRYTKLSEYHRWFQKNHEDLAKLFEDVPETLVGLKNDGRRLAIVTARTGSANKLLGTFGINDLFDVVITGDMFENPKPHRQSFLMALEHLNSFPSRAVMVGDTFPDILGGKGVGMRTIGALYGHEGQRIRLAGADAYADSFSQIRQKISELETV